MLTSGQHLRRIGFEGPGRVNNPLLLSHLEGIRATLRHAPAVLVQEEVSPWIAPPLDTVLSPTETASLRICFSLSLPERKTDRKKSIPKAKSLTIGY